MKTRTLLLLAVSCGLVILVAGSVKLFLISDAKSPAHLTIGESTTVGDMRVTVVSAERRSGMTLIAVELVGVDDVDGATSWVFGAGGDAQLRPLAPPPDVGKKCSATSATTPTRCVLAFATDAPRGVLSYDRAGEKRLWDIVGT